ncbi:MAG: EI24 domain-containing protein [Bacteroidota bacterium]
MRSASFPVQFIKDFVLTIRNHQQAMHFIARHKLWKGLMRYGWVSKLVLFVGLIAGLKLFLILNHWWNSATGDSIAHALQSLGSLFKEVAFEGYEFFFVGGFKYLILIIMEILLFHITRRTIEIKTGKSQDLTIDAFIKAEIRMIKTAISAFILESIGTVAIGVVLGVIGYDFLQPFFVLLLQCYFLGFVVIDNYNELYSMSIRESERVTREFFGVAIAIGLVTYLLLLLPIVGAVLAPFVGAVTATLTMHSLQDEFQKFVPLQHEMV